MTASVSVLQKRPPPPSGLSSEAKGIWTAIVESLRVDYFIESDLLLLEQYVAAIVAANKAREILAKQGPVIDGKINPHFLILDHESKRIATFSIRLRLAPQSRYDRAVAGGKVRPVSRAKWEKADPDQMGLARYGL